MTLASRIAHKGKLALTDYISLIVFAISIALLSNDGILSVTSFLSAMGFSLLFVGALGAVVSIKYHRPWLTHATIEFVGMWICVLASGSVPFAIFAYVCTAVAILAGTFALCRGMWNRAVPRSLTTTVGILGITAGIMFFILGLSLITGVKYFT